MEDIIKSHTKKNYISRTDGICDPIDNSQYYKLSWLYRICEIQVVVGFFVAYGVADTSSTSKWFGFALFAAIWNVLMLILLLNVDNSQLGKHQFDNILREKSYKQDFIDTIKRQVNPNYKILLQ
jgi:hypothetical protein